jgi:hypothetical protein
MDRGTTPAERLLGIVLGLQPANPKKETWRAFAKAFGLEGVATGNNPPALFHFLSIVYTQIDLARDRAARGPLASSPALYNGPLNQLRNGLNAAASSLNGVWAPHAEHFKSIVSQLTYLAALDKGNEEAPIPEEVTAELLLAISSIRKALESEGLTEAARSILHRQIEMLVTLVASYGVGGGRAFSDAVVRAVTELQETKPDFSGLPPEAASSIVNAWRAVVKIVKTIGHLASAIQAIQAFAAAAEATGLLSLPFLNDDKGD